jgi:hypothetical protein
MDAVAVTVGIGWTLGGALCFALSIPLARGHVGRNALYGARFPESFASDEAWFAINRFAGRRLAVWSVPLIAVGLVSFFLPLQTHTMLMLVLGFGPLVFLLVPLVQSWRFARGYRPKA